jgi:cell division septum initiation protein DivIVA
VSSDEHLDETEGLANADVDTLVRRVIDIVASAKSMPLSASVLISRDEVLELLEEAAERLPDELRRARWMLREREEFLEKTRRESERILESARVQAERMVQRTEIARQAEHEAERILEAARDESSRLRHEAEDFCDQKLAAFEIVLERTAKLVHSGRAKLQMTPSPPPEASRADDEEGGEVPAPAEEGFFDQDRV